MTTYIILSKLAANALEEPGQIRKLADNVTRRIKEECPRVRWKDSYALMGRYDVLDIVEADSLVEVEKAAMLIRCYGHATTETLPGTPWKEFVGGM